jgi:hypothetical protein
MQVLLKNVPMVKVNAFFDIIKLFSFWNSYIVLSHCLRNVFYMYTLVFLVLCWCHNPECYKRSSTSENNHLNVKEKILAWGERHLSCSERRHGLAGESYWQEDVFKQGQGYVKVLKPRAYTPDIEPDCVNESC